MAARALRRQDGFTYVGLIILVTVIGMAGAATLKVGSLLQRAEAEHELLELGAAFSAALQSYAAATPRGQPPQPTSLQDLLRDPRFPFPRRHLRKIFVDPVTGKAEWGILSAGEGGRIVGVYSLSQAKPLKIANFDARFLNLENKARLSDWKFTANGQGVSTARPPARTVPPQGLVTPPAPPPPPVARQAVLQELVRPASKEEEEQEPAAVAPPRARAEPEAEPEQAETPGAVAAPAAGATER
jgi:type II secretory pathway pseudopilin PulG